MLALDLDIKQSLVKVSLSSSSFQNFDLIFFELATSLFFQLFLTDLCTSLFSLFDLQPRLESGLHANAYVCAIASLVRVAPYLRNRFVCIDRDECTMLCLYRELLGCLLRWGYDERLFWRDSLTCGRQDAETVTA